ncbi:hypothetical protein AG1IA_04012 [Rhizoctonia solani AG-1 IA]|uniref:Uncharacterized protein n=1 Tax=Thanatephorus cucumeris (strain AG1-IA) TaxID=983506 RepID=L8WYW2_THACA|nr:hypothetical protein AG1IA_04012 [Rhizoctonia solani AG-1 IA]
MSSILDDGTDRENKSTLGRAPCLVRLILRSRSPGDKRSVKLEGKNSSRSSSSTALSRSRGLMVRCLSHLESEGAGCLPGSCWSKLYDKKSDLDPGAENGDDPNGAGLSPRTGGDVPAANPLILVRAACPEINPGFPGDAAGGEPTGPKSTDGLLRDKRPDDELPVGRERGSGDGRRGGSVGAAADCAPLNAPGWDELGSGRGAATDFVEIVSHCRTRESCWCRCGLGYGDRSLGPNTYARRRSPEQCRLAFARLGTAISFGTGAAVTLAGLAGGCFVRGLGVATLLATLSSSCLCSSFITFVHRHRLTREHVGKGALVAKLAAALDKPRTHAFGFPGLGYMVREWTRWPSSTPPNLEEFAGNASTNPWLYVSYSLSPDDMADADSHAHLLGPFPFPFLSLSAADSSGLLAGAVVGIVLGDLKESISGIQDRQQVDGGLL